MARHDPLRNFRYRLEIDGLQTAAFSEVSIGTTSTDIIDYREGNDPARVRKLPGLTHYGSVLLKHGVTASLELPNWHRQVVSGQLTRKTVAIVVLDETGLDAARFVVTDAWPAKYSVKDLNATGNEVLIETLELANEGIERVQ
jgi:phage tail-like protein